MYNWILTIGKLVDRILLFIFMISLVMGIVGLISGAVWTSTAWLVSLFSLGYSLFWFIFVLLFLHNKAREEKGTDLDCIIKDIKKRR